MAVAIGVLAFAFGFSMIWHIWWLAIGSFLGLIAVVIARASLDDIHYSIPAAEVARLESLRYANRT